MDSITLQQIKDQYAKERGYDDWRDFVTGYAYCNLGGTREEALNEILHRYATACCKATQEKIASHFNSSADLFYINQSANVVIL